MRAAAQAASRPSTQGTQRAQALAPSSALAFAHSLRHNAVVDEQDQRISETVAREQARLRNFIRMRVPDALDAEDILQDVFSELVEAYRLMKPIEQVGAWLFRVARNRIIDSFRKHKPAPLSHHAQHHASQQAQATFADEADSLSLEDLLPSRDAGPEAAYARSILLAELEAALDELPPEQRAVFIAHEIDGRSFKEIAAETGLTVNTLLSRKHYAVLHLRQRLRDAYDELNSRR